MDMGLIRGLVTLVVFVAFIALVVGIYSRQRKAHFEEAGRMILDDDSAENVTKENLS